MVRLKMYTEELLAACLTFVLSVPAEVACENITQIVPALQVRILVTLIIIIMIVRIVVGLVRWCLQ
jgi:hypothetical protein